MQLDLFTWARLKITFLYLLLGTVIIVVAGYFVYSDLTAVISNTLKIFQTLLAEGPSVDQATAAAVITASIKAQLAQMDVAIGIWLLVAMVFCAYLLAGITLRPVKRDMERQKRFMANISHELRTPLSVMRTTTEADLLDIDNVTREELIETKRSNLEEIDRMTKIIEFLLNFSNIENRMSRLTFGTVDLSEIAKKVLGLVTARAKQKNVHLVLETEPAALSGNTTALEEAALNLVKNAVTYTPAGGTVWISVTKRYGAVTLSVRDNGIGIAEKDMPNIFEAFYRGSGAGAHSDGTSSGLGLAMVKEISALHDAKISVRSEVGKGTTITLRFPSRLSRMFTPWS